MSRLRMLQASTIILAVGITSGLHTATSLAAEPSSWNTPASPSSPASPNAVGSPNTLASPNSLKAFDLEASAEYFKNGIFYYAAVTTRGYNNDRPVGRPYSVDLDCEHSYTTQDGTYHEVRGFLYGSGNNASGVGAVLGNGSEDNTSAHGFMGVSGSGFGPSDAPSSGSARGVFQTDNGEDSLTGGQVTITITGGVVDNQYDSNFNYIGTFPGPSSLSCVASAPGGGEAELE